MLNLIWGVRSRRRRSFVAFVVIIVLHGLLNTFGVNLVKLLSDVSAWWHLVGVAVIVARARVRPGPAPVPGVDVHRVPQRDRLDQLGLRRPHRSADGPVHLHRVRRLRARRGGDQERLRRGAQGHRAQRLGLHPRRLGPARRRHRGDPGLHRRAQQRRRGCRRHRSSSTRPGARSASSCCSSARWRSSSAAWRRSRRTPACPTRSPGTARCPARGCGPRSTRAPARRPTRSGCASSCSLVLAAPALKSLVAYFAVTSIAVIGLYIAYVVPVFLRRRNPDFRTGAVAPGPVERADRLDRRRLGRLHRHPVHAPGLRTDHRRHVQLRARRRPGGAADRHRCSGSCADATTSCVTCRRGTTPGPPDEIFD